MVHSVSGWMRGVQVILWDPLRTRDIPEHLRGVFTTRRHTNTRLPYYLTLPQSAWEIRICKGCRCSCTSHLGFISLRRHRHGSMWTRVTTYGKPGVLRDFYEHGNLGEFSGNSVQPRGKFLTCKVVSVRSNICVTQQGLGLQMNKVSWISETVTVSWGPVILLDLMWNDPWHTKVVITFTLCCNNRGKSIVYGPEKSLENFREFFLVLCGHPDGLNVHQFSLKSPKPCRLCCQPVTSL